METETYIRIVAHRYEYNDGRANNGYYVHNYDFPDTKGGRAEAKAFAERLNRALSIKEKLERGEMVTKEDRDWYYSFEEGTGFYTAYAIYKVKIEKEPVTL